MEITSNLPTVQWYKNGTDNDLLYWGLDYPPLSAYHMRALGMIAGWLNQSYVALNSSRGLESYEHKVFMRSTVQSVDLLLFFSALTALWWVGGLSSRAVAAALMYPALILVDHGHFQYNCVSLGLTVWAVVLLTLERRCLATLAFTLAINYKQISLYHALPLFSFLLSTCWRQPSLGQRLWLLVKLSSVVVLTFVLCWLPFLSRWQDVEAVLKRLFPVDRGLFEDKVANVWCFLDVLLKLRRRYPPATLLRLSGVSTLLFVLPTCVHLFLSPSLRSLKYSLIQSSLAFFLFSFQVHEKGILLAGVAVSLVLDSHPLLASWFFVVSTFRSVE